MKFPSLIEVRMARRNKLAGAKFVEVHPQSTATKVSKGFESSPDVQGLQVTKGTEKAWLEAIAALKE